MRAEIPCFFFLSAHAQIVTVALPRCPPVPVAINAQPWTVGEKALPSHIYERRLSLRLGKVRTTDRMIPEPPILDPRQNYLDAKENSYRYVAGSLPHRRD